MHSTRIVVALLMLCSCVSCKQIQSQHTVVVHVVSDPSAQFAQALRQANSEFAVSQPRLGNGKIVIAATNEGDSYAKLLKQLSDRPIEVLIPNSSSDLPNNSALRADLGTPVSVCGGKSAYIPTWVSSEVREASELYVRFLETHCR